MDFALESSKQRKTLGEGIRLAEARRRLAAAKKRAQYWSGVSFSGAATSLLKKGAHNRAHQGYHASIAEVRESAALIYRLTGRRPRPFDPKSRIKETGQGLLPISDGAAPPDISTG